MGDPSASGAEEEGEPRRTVGKVSHDTGISVLIGLLMECNWCDPLAGTRDRRAVRLHAHVRPRTITDVCRHG